MEKTGQWRGDRRGLWFAGGLLLLFAGFCLLRRVCRPDPVFDVFQRVLAFGLVGLLLPLVWIKRTGAPAESPASIYRQIILTVAAIATAVFLFPELWRDGGPPSPSAAAGHLLAAAGTAYFAFRFVFVLLPERPFMIRLVWSTLVVLGAVPELRGALVGGAAALLCLAAGSWLPGVLLLWPLFAVETQSAYGWLSALPVLGILVLLLFTLRRSPAFGPLGHHAGQYQKADPLGDVDDQKGQHQGVGGGEIIADEGGEGKAQGENA